MKLSKLALLAALITGSSAGANEGRQAYYQQTGNESGVARVSHCDCEDPVCGCEAPSGDAPSCDEQSCDDGCESSCDGGCDSMSGCGFGSCLDGIGCCDLGEPWTLFKQPRLGLTIGGWTDIGYHTSNNAGGGILGAGGAPSNFNNYDSRVQLQQQWLYAERIADGSSGLGFGGRVDYIYGTDAQDTQSFGIANNHWDNTWDRGAVTAGYGHAMPQLYGEVAYGKTSVKIGHFFTIIGNEVVQATGNFFYSRQFTFYNSEPFTHTGALATHALNDETTIYGGYVMGWDSGFEDNGDSYLGGIKRQVTEDFSVLYTTALGRFNDDANSTNARERGQIHNLIFTTALTDKLTNIIQLDYLDTNDDTGERVRLSKGVNAYFIYRLSDCIALGSRSEYYHWATGANVPTPINGSELFNQTIGVNYKPHANVTFRPEVRWVYDIDKVGVNENADYNQATFGMDAIFTF